MHRDKPDRTQGDDPKNRADLSLTKQCKLLKISRSSLYYVPVGVNAETLELMNEIDRVFTKYPFFGSRQIAAYLPRNGFHAGRHRVRRMMGIKGRQGAKHQQKAPAASDLPLSSTEITNHAPEPRLVQRHCLYLCAPRVPLLGGDYGLGDAQSVGELLVNLVFG